MAARAGRHLGRTGKQGPHKGGCPIGLAGYGMVQPVSNATLGQGELRVEKFPVAPSLGDLKKIGLNEQTKGTTIVFKKCIVLSLQNYMILQVSIWGH